MIKVIEQSTAERRQETIDLFNKVKPLVDDGWAFRQAVLHITGKTSIGTQKRGWYRDLCEYAKTQGYNPKDYEWIRRKP